MSILDLILRRQPQPPERKTSALGESLTFYGYDDPSFLEFIRTGGASSTAAGITVSAASAMRNTTVIRCVSLIAFAVAMLPLHLRMRSTKAIAEHPLDTVLHRKPNTWQTAFEFRSVMQQRALVHGDAFARIVRVGKRITQLVPIDNACVTVKQRADWSLEYEIKRPNQEPVTLQQSDMFHVRFGLSEDGYTGLSLVVQAAEAIALAIQTENASSRLFKNGMLVGQILKHPAQLSPEAFERLKASMADREGASNAYKTLILEEGMEIEAGATTGVNAQQLEQRKHQIEEIARPFGVPRPLLGVDDTSWGSGIDVLGQFFVRYALAPWFTAWEQAIERDLLTDGETLIYEAKFNPAALLRGSMKEQADFFASALGSGGHAPWMAAAEVREIMDMPPRDDLPVGANNERTSNVAP